MCLFGGFVKPNSIWSVAVGSSVSRYGPVVLWCMCSLNTGRDYYYYYYIRDGDRGSTVVKVLRYKSEGR